MPSIKRIAISTGGGDAPGLNAVIHAVVLSARRLGWSVVGIKRGHEGLLDTSQTVELTEEAVWNITALGGTILGTTNKGNPFEYPVNRPDGGVDAADRSAEVMANFRKLGLDCLVAVGGDGSLKIAQRFMRMGMPVIGVPKTIDNDLASTVYTFGFDTAVSTATDAIDKLRTTAESHRRVMVVEVMGRYAGWIALDAGVAGSADAILIPEIPYDIEKVCDKVRARDAAGFGHSLIVVSEGARARGGEMIFAEGASGGHAPKLGGVSQRVAEEIAKRTGKETRTMVLGHLQRGGGPTTFDRLLSLRFGTAAVRAIEAGKFGHMVAIKPPVMDLVPIDEAVAKLKTVPLDSDILLTARGLGMCLGD
jgi:6-phosphofructokinase 1